MDSITNQVVVRFQGGPFDGTVTVSRAQLDNHATLTSGTHVEAAVRIWKVIQLMASEGVAISDMIGCGVGCNVDGEKSVNGRTHIYGYAQIQFVGDCIEIDLSYSGVSIEK